VLENAIKILFHFFLFSLQIRQSIYFRLPTIKYRLHSRNLDHPEFRLYSPNFEFHSIGNTQKQNNDESSFSMTSRNTLLIRCRAVKLVFRLTITGLKLRYPAMFYHIMHFIFSHHKEEFGYYDP
ncbi:hypothetical protein V1478_009176, partial [Vespula squamosa]